jgi:hypothetical protein
MPQTHVIELELNSSTPQSLLDRLGDPLFSREEQLANDDLPRTRIVKDVLKPGDWKGWKVKAGTLREIARQYELAQRNGEQSNLYWGSAIKTPGGQHNVEAKNAIAPIDRLIVHDDVLYAVSYVTPAVAKELSNPAHKVSVKVVDPYVDGAGNRYNLFLEHIAVVDHAAVTGQQNFLALANDADDEPVGTDMGELVAVVNEMLGLMGLSPVEADVPAEQLVATLRTKLVTLRDLTDGPEAGDSETAMSDDKKTAETQQLEARIAELEAANAALVQQQEDQKRSQWSAALDNLFRTNRIDAKTKALLEKAGPAFEYDLSNLDEYQDESLNESERRIRQLANGDEPSVGDKGQFRNPLTGQVMTGQRTDEQVAKELEAAGIKA